MSGETRQTNGLRGLMVLALVAGLMAGCSSRRGEGGEPDAGDRPVVSEARVHLEAILDAYSRWDLEGVLAHVHRDFYPQFTLFRQALYEDRKQVSRVELNVVVDQEIASGDSVVLRTHWNRVHVPSATGTPVRSQGQATWHFDRVSGLLVDIRGQRPIAFN